MPVSPIRTKPSSPSPTKSANPTSFSIQHDQPPTTKSATGRRKTAVARVWLTEGTGQIIINGRSFEEYLPTIDLQNAVLAPFQARERCPTSST